MADLSIVRSIDAIQIIVGNQQDAEQNPPNASPYYFGAVESGALTDSPSFSAAGPPYTCQAANVSIPTPGAIICGFWSAS